MRDIHFIHISDLHIGKQPEELVFGTCSLDDVKNTLKRVVDEAEKTKPDFIFITGDLFEHPASKDELEWLDKMFLPLKETAIIYCQGNCDYLKEGSPLTSFHFQSNVYAAGCSRYNNQVKPESVVYGEKDENATAMIDIIHFKKAGVYIYCAGYYTPDIQMPILEGLVPYDKTEKNILLAHAGGAGAIPIHFSDIKKAGFDYVGLGHNLNYKNMYNGRVCYAGSLEPLSCKETGPHGYVSGFIRPDETRISFVAASEKEYKTIQYPVSNYMTDEELCEELIRLMKQEGNQHIFQIHLVRQSKCEKTFHIKDRLSKFRISSVTGERFDRTNYDEYRRANRGTDFGKLLACMDAESPIKEDGAKLAVDSVIECSRIYTRNSSKMSDRIFEDAAKQAKTKLEETIRKMRSSKEIKEYEHAKQLLEQSPDVLEKLNESWAEERKAMLALRTLKNSHAQIMPRHRRKWLRTGMYAALVPFVIFCITAIFLLPNAYIRMAEQLTSGDVIQFLVSSVLAIVICFVVGYGFAKWIDYNKANGIKQELYAAFEKEKQMETQGEKLCSIRKEYQMQDSRRREIQSDVSIRESRIAKATYELQVLEEAAAVLEKQQEV